jgi:apolipoprotein N-acyltransferase
MVDLIVWPETSLNYPISAAGNEISVVANGSHVIVGYQHRKDNNAIYNSLGIISPNGSVGSEYHKHKLVPFGEYLPFSAFFRKMGLRSLATSDGGGFSRGTGPEVFWVPSIGNIQPLICYEGIFPQFVGRASDRPDLLVLISNDAWFGEGQGIAQHLAQARARTIELGLPMVRVANRGITTVIDARGSFSDALGFDDRGALDLRVPPALTPTFYAVYGEVVFCLFLFFVVCVWLFINFQKTLLTRLFG